MLARSEELRPMATVLNVLSTLPLVAACLECLARLTWTAVFRLANGNV
jgi:hypothetical protein